MLLNNQHITEEIKQEIKKINLKTNDKQKCNIQNIGDTAKEVLRREVFNNTILI